MAFELPFPPFPHDSRDVPFIATPDDNNGYAVPSSQYFKKLVGDKNVWVPVSADDPLPTSDATMQTRIGEVQAVPTANTLLARLKSLEDKIDEITAGTTPANVQLSGRNVAKTKVTNWINAETITAGSSKTYYYPTLNYPDELYLLMRIDKQPWSITGSTPFMSVAGDKHTFPDYSFQNPATLTAHVNYTMIVLFVTGGFPNAYKGIGFNPTTLDEAKKCALPMQGLSGKTMVFYNKHTTDDCTLSIQLLEVWR